MLGPRLSGFVALAGLAIIAAVSMHSCAHAQQPAQWSYSFDASNKAIASYPGAAGANEYFTISGEGLTAAGSTQATAYNLSAAPNGNAVFTTVAAGTGVVLDADLPLGGIQTLWNLGANSLTCYPPGGDTLDGSTSQIVTVAQGVYVMHVSPGNWRTLANSGSSGGGSIPATLDPLCGSGVAGLAQACGALQGLVTGAGNLSVAYGTTVNTALEGSTRGAASGVAELDGSTLIPLAELPVIINNTLGTVLCDGGGINSALGCTMTGLTSSGGSLAVTYGHSANEAIVGSDVGSVNGVAALDSGGLIPIVQNSAAVQAVGLAFSYVGTPAASALRQQILPFACELPANLQGSAGTTVDQTTQGYAATGAAGSAWTVAYISGGSPGTFGALTMTAHGISAYPTHAAVSLARGDVVSVTAPATPDATAADIVLTVGCGRS